MKPSKLNAWKQEMRVKYGAIRVVPTGSLEARGCRKVGRKLLWQGKSPSGGDYSVFSNETRAEKAQ